MQLIPVKLAAKGFTKCKAPDRFFLKFLQYKVSAADHRKQTKAGILKIETGTGAGIIFFKMSTLC